MSLAYNHGSWEEATARFAKAETKVREERNNKRKQQPKRNKETGARTASHQEDQQVGLQGTKVKPSTQIRCARYTNNYDKGRKKQHKETWLHQREALGDIRKYNECGITRDLAMNSSIVGGIRGLEKAGILEKKAYKYYIEEAKHCVSKRRALHSDSDKDIQARRKAYTKALFDRHNVEENWSTDSEEG